MAIVNRSAGVEIFKVLIYGNLYIGPSIEIGSRDKKILIMTKSIYKVSSSLTVAIG